jgi:hypothetical protein
MATERFSAESIVRLLERRQVVTMDELKEALGTGVDMTVFRKLRTLDYLSSYSHGGRHYALQGGAEFDRRGLWTYRGVHFSRFGSLLDTVEAFVNRAERGYLASELTAELQVQTKEPLLKLVRLRRLSREQISGAYVYCSIQPVRRREQLIMRKQPAEHGQAFAPMTDRSVESNEAKAALVLFMSLLDEKQRRLFGGLESLRLGWGGDREVAEAIGLDPHTVAKGRKELLDHDVEMDRLRRPGGGRPSTEKKLRRRSKRSRKS